MTARERGWYADPVAVGAARYWDGRAWTDVVSWGGNTKTDPTPIAEVERRLAAAEADVVRSYLDNAAERGLISRETVSRLLPDLQQRSRVCTQVTAHQHLPPPSPAAVNSRLPSPRRHKSAVEPVGIEPVRVEPGSIARWWGRTREAVRSDLVLHGLAYLGVLLMFAGVVGLIAFSFGDISAEFRTLTELLVPTSLLVAGRYLQQRGAPTVSGALTLIGAGLVPLVALASVTDNAPFPPDVTGRALPVVHGALCIAIATAMYAIARRRDDSTPLRFLVAPVIWLGVGLFAPSSRTR